MKRIKRTDDVIGLGYCFNAEEPEDGFEDKPGKPSNRDLAGTIVHRLEIPMNEFSDGDFARIKALEERGYSPREIFETGLGDTEIWSSKETSDIFFRGLIELEIKMGSRAMKLIDGRIMFLPNGSDFISGPCQVRGLVKEAMEQLLGKASPSTVEYIARELSGWGDSEWNAFYDADHHRLGYLNIPTDGFLLHFKVNSTLDQRISPTGAFLGVYKTTCPSSFGRKLGVAEEKAEVDELEWDGYAR